MSTSVLKRINQLTSICLAPLLLSGCLFGKHGTIHDRSNEYLNSQNEPALKVPANAQLVDHDPAYPVPAGQPLSREAVSLLPPGFDSDVAATTNVAAPAASIELTQSDSKHIQLQLNNTKPAVAWRNVTAALTKSGYQIIGSDQSNGLIEISGKVSPQEGTEVYQIKIVSQPTLSVITVLDQSGALLDTKTAKVLLEQIKSQV